MRKAKVTVPAVSTNLGPGVESLGLALSMHVTATFVERSDSQLLIETHGEDSADLSPDCYHPVMYAAIRVFQRLEDSPAGLRIDIRNAIPLQSGLGAEEAMTVAGLIGANSLMGNPLERDELLAIGAEIMGRADGLIGAMLGGLTMCAAEEEGPLLYRRMSITPYKVLIILPQITDYEAELVQPAAKLNAKDALFNLGHLALAVEALREGDFELMGRTFHDRLLTPALEHTIPGYHQAIQAAYDAGAAAVTVSGQGPALVVFTLFNHYKIADAVQSVFDTRDILSRVWTLTVDTQGVVVTAAETLPG
jgi:homoserine kinase